MRDDAVDRERARGATSNGTREEERPSPGYPWGWFAIAFSEELTSGAPHAMRYFGRDLVAFRGRDGAAAVLDAYCPHRGTHLGIGGCVADGELRCPRHGWRFGADGRCTHVPDALEIPPGAAVRAWPVCERNGVVHVWFHPRGEPPRYEMPLVEEWGKAGWSGWRHKCLEVATHPREIVENVVDVAHFVPVHATDARQFENEFRDHLAIQRSGGVGASNNRYEGAGYALVATYHGAGVQLTTFESRGVKAVLLNAHTMIDESRLHLRFAVMLEETLDPARRERFHAAYVRDLQTGFEQDIAIWTNKKWRDVPVLCDKDGPIMRLRQWYAQFYR
jgi:3-ketosteroid 9alpha-monooxygenase subunit A